MAQVDQAFKVRSCRTRNITSSGKLHQWRTRWGLRVLGELRELYVLASILPITVEVPVEVWAMFLAVLATLAAVLMATLAELPLVMPVLGGEEQALFGIGLLLALLLILLLAPLVEFCVYTSP
jgi:hypothetical protein